MTLSPQYCGGRHATELAQIRSKGPIDAGIVPFSVGISPSGHKSPKRERSRWAERTIPTSSSSPRSSRWRCKSTPRARSPSGCTVTVKRFGLGLKRPRPHPTPLPDLSPSKQTSPSFHSGWIKRPSTMVSMVMLKRHLTTDCDRSCKITLMPQGSNEFLSLHLGRGNVLQSTPLILT